MHILISSSTFCVPPISRIGDHLLKKNQLPFWLTLLFWLGTSVWEELAAPKKMSGSSEYFWRSFGAKSNNKSYGLYTIQISSMRIRKPKTRTRQKFIYSRVNSCEHFIKLSKRINLALEFSLSLFFWNYLPCNGFRCQIPVVERRRDKRSSARFLKI